MADQNQTTDRRLWRFANNLNIPPMEVQFMASSGDWVMAQRIGFCEPKVIPLLEWLASELINDN